jgi:hypothetical protein
MFQSNINYEFSTESFSDGVYLVKIHTVDCQIIGKNYSFMELFFKNSKNKLLLKKIIFGKY